jgi:hypothetical protein
MSNVSWAIEADLDRDGTFETSLTTYVEAPGSGIAIERGADRNGEPMASTMRVHLANRGGEFNARNLSSPFSGKLLPGFPVRVTATHAGVSYTVWTGYARRLRVAGAGTGEASMAELEAESLFAFMRGDTEAMGAPPAAPIYVSAQEGRTVRAAMEAIATAAGLTAAEVLDLWPSGQYETLEWHFVSGQNPFQAWVEAAASEMGGAFYELADARVRLEPRDARVGRSHYHRLGRRFGAVLDLRFEERGGTTAYDYSGAAHHGTYVGSPTLGAADLIPGAGGSSADFEADSSQYVTVPDHADLDVGDTFTAEFLFRPESFSAAQCLAAKGNNSFIILIDTAGKIVLAQEGVGNIVESTASLQAGQTHHVVVTKAGSTVHLYLDGVDVTGTVTNRTLTDTAVALHVGRAASSATSYLDGVLRSARIYRTALTAAQVAELAAALEGMTWGPGTSIVPVRWEWLQDEADVATRMEVRANDFLEGQATIPLLEFSRNMFTRPTATSMALAAGEVWERDFDIAVAYTSLATPVAHLDYEANTAIDGSGTDKTASLNVTATEVGPGRFRLRLVNTDAGTIYVTFFKVRGVPLDLFADRAIAVVEKGLSGHPTGRGVAFDVPFWNGSNLDVLRYAHSELRVARYPAERMRLTFWPANDTARAALLGLELGDLVYYDDRAVGAGRGAYVADWYYVEGISHSIPPDLAGATWQCDVRLVPVHNWRDWGRSAFDTFGRADATGDLGTAESGQAWANDGNMDIVSGAARANSDTLQMPNVDLGALAYDQVVEVSLSAIGTGDEVGVVLRYVDANNQYRCYLDRGSNEVILEKNVSGAVTEITSPAYTVGSAHELRVVVQGERFRCWVDQALQFDVEDTALNTGTRVGLFARNASGTAQFDDFYAAAV